MSKESAKAYIERLQNDGDFAGQVARCKNAAAKNRLLHNVYYRKLPLVSKRNLSRPHPILFV